MQKGNVPDVKLLTKTSHQDLSFNIQMLHPSVSNNPITHHVHGRWMAVGLDLFSSSHPVSILIFLLVALRVSYIFLHRFNLLMNLFNPSVWTYQILVTVLVGLELWLSPLEFNIKFCGFDVKLFLNITNLNTQGADTLAFAHKINVSK